MKKRIRGLCRGFFLCLSVLLFSGCMESRELKERTIIEAVGIDESEEGYRLIFQQYEPQQNAKGSEGVAEEQSTPVQAEGKSLSQAIDRVTHYNGDQVFLGNSTYVVFGEAAASNGILQELHYFNGENEISPSVFLVLADGSAEELIRAQAQRKESSASTIRELLEQGEKNGIIGSCSLRSVMERLLSGSTSPYLPLVSAVEEEKGAETGKSEGNEESSSGSQAPVRFQISGLGIFRGECLAMLLPMEEAKGVLWANDEIKRMLMVLEDEELGILSLEIQKSKTKVNTAIQDGRAMFHLTVDCQAQLLERLGMEKSAALSRQEKERAERSLEEEIQKTIETAVERCLIENGCDVFRFGDWLKKQQPRYWKENQSRWQELMPTCDVRVSVHCRINKSGQQAME